MSTRKIHQAPTYVEVQAPEDLRKIVLEIQKFKPEVEVSVENHSDLARGRIVAWNETTRLFTVEWKSMDEHFTLRSGERTGLRTFVRAKLFSTQILFKCELIRRLKEGPFQYRTPLMVYRNQKRSSLRVPVGPGIARLQTPLGVFPVLDLSVAGARVGIPSSVSRNHSSIEECQLLIGKRRITPEGFGIRITNRFPDSVGCRFHGLNESVHVELKQFLMEALHDFFKEVHGK